MTQEARFPPAEFVRRGPPTEIRDLDRQAREKWSRLMLVIPRSVDMPDRTRYDFVRKGPYTLPLATLRDGADKGSRDAWQFFTHPYAVFPEDASFYNVTGKGCLGARLYVRGPQGVRIYDEVGANLDKSEFVSDSFHGALGVLRARILGDPDRACASPMAPDLLELDLDLLELFHCNTLLLKSNTPLKVLSELYRLLLRPTLNAFAWEIFSDEEHDLMRALRANDLDERALARSAIRFRVRREEFTKVTDVRDRQGRQAVLEMLQEWERFEQQHGDRLSELERGIHEAEQQLGEIRQRAVQLQNDRQGQKGLSRLFRRTDRHIKDLKAEAVHAIRRKRELEEAYDELPGYAELKGLTSRIQGFEASVESTFQIARDLVDHGVRRAQLNELRGIVKNQILAEGQDPAGAVKAYKHYDLRLRAEILPRLLASYSLSAYVLRRPDALDPSKASRRNVVRINQLALSLIDYFRYVRYGKSNLGEAFDSSWGQVLQIESRL